MDNITTIRPAKRIFILHSLALFLVLLSLALGLGQLHHQIGLDWNTIKAIWKAATLIGLGFLLYSFLWRLTSVFTISRECVGSTIGILSKSHIRIPMNRIVDYQVITPLLERILGLGSIHIDTAGDEDLIMRQISRQEIDSAVFRLDKLLNKEQRRSDSVLSMAT